jgi:hypothetical protein
MASVSNCDYICLFLSQGIPAAGSSLYVRLHLAIPSHQHIPLDLAIVFTHNNGSQSHGSSPRPGFKRARQLFSCPNRQDIVRLGLFLSFALSAGSISGCRDQSSASSMEECVSPCCYIGRVAVRVRLLLKAKVRPKRSLARLAAEVLAVSLTRNSQRTS